VTYFLGRVETLAVRLSEEHSEHRWAVVEDARKILPFENLRALVTRAWMIVAPLLPQFEPESSPVPQP
jgi:hypothetical protein